MTWSSQQQMVAAVVDGDLQAFVKLLEQPPMQIDAERDSIPRLTLTGDGVLRVLKAFQDKEVSPGLVQQWASFVRRGYFGSVPGPRRPIAISYEIAAEDQIVEVIARLDELGDLIDGQIQGEELAHMIHAMKYCHLEQEGTAS